MQGTQHERELAAGASRALRWADVLRPLRLCVRIQASWGGMPAVEPCFDVTGGVCWHVADTFSHCCNEPLRELSALGTCFCCLQEAGWMWSGGFELDTPGDMFIKIRSLA